MSEEEKFYKYVILRDRDGNYLLPYTGVQGLADVAFTGRYRDLIDTPEEDSFLPASKNTASGAYTVSHSVIFNDPIILDQDIAPIVDGDLAKDTYIVNEDYVYNTVDYLMNNFQRIIDEAIEEMSNEGGDDPEEEIIKRYCGSVNTRAALNNITGELYDVYYVLDELRWYMCVLNNVNVKVWVNEYKGKEVTP